MAVNLFSHHNCDVCGRFVSIEAPGVSLAEIFDFVGMQPDHTRIHCPSCTSRIGPAQSNARPANGDMSPYEHMIPLQERNT